MTSDPRPGPSAVGSVAAAACAFCIVAILNCGGYRYGIGDQAFYVPAVTQHLNPHLFPPDRTILHAQDRVMLYVEAIAVLVRVTGVPGQYLSGLVLQPPVTPSAASASIQSAAQ